MGGAMPFLGLIGSLLGPIMGSVFKSEPDQPDMTPYYESQKKNQELMAKQQADMKASMDAQNALMQKQYDEAAMQNKKLQDDANAQKKKEEDAMAQAAEKARKQHLAAITGGSQMTLLTRGTSADELTGGKKTQLGG